MAGHRVKNYLQLVAVSTRTGCDKIMGFVNETNGVSGDDLPTADKR